MPTHRGINLSVVSRGELKIHPEFPHPDTSQFTFRSPNLKKLGTLIKTSTSLASSDSKADRVLGRPSCVSVYIPSLSGTQFWIRYSITDSAVAAYKWCYFKLFMNGRHITSWGASSKTTPSGQVMRALFEPSDRWNYKDNGTVYKNNGTEARPFFFDAEVDGCSAADDGGLIEVLVFRARGRRRRAASLEEFRNQERYGIVMPSGGLLDRPQDAKFYDWHLKDPKDNPFATFRFHYRSWDNLTALQLIPADHPRTLLPATPSLLSLNNQSWPVAEQLWEERKVDLDVETEIRTAGADIRDSSSSCDSVTPWMITVFDDSPNHSRKFENTALAVPDRSSPFYPGHDMIEVPTSKFSEATAGRRSEQLGWWTEVSDRPLPDIPTRCASLNHSRNSSTVSHAPSIAASLLPYLDRESTTSPEPVLGIAAVVPVLRSGFGDHSSQDDQSSESSSEPDIAYTSDLSRPWTTASKKQEIVSPPRAKLYTLPHIPIREQRHSPYNHLSPPDTVLPDNEQADRAEEGHKLYNQNTQLTLTESEWMCRTPSPVRNDPEHARFEKLWSPGVEVNRASKDASALKKEALDWCRQMSGREERDENSKFGLRIDGVKTMTGNWI